MRDNYEIISGSDYVHIKGVCNITVDGACNVKSQSATVQADSILFDTPRADFTGDVNIEGNHMVGGNQAIEGMSTAEDHISGGISGNRHRHLETGVITRQPI